MRQQALRFGLGVLALFFAVQIILPLPAIGGALDDARREWANGHPDKAIKILTPVAEAGDAEAQYQLGQIHSQMPELLLDHGHKEASFRWTKAAAEQGHVLAMVFLATDYFYATGVEFDLERARFWSCEAILRGSDVARHNLRMMQQSVPALPDCPTTTSAGNAPTAPHVQTRVDQTRPPPTVGTTTAYMLLIKKDWVGAQKAALPSAVAGDPGAQAIVGMIFATGAGGVYEPFAGIGLLTLAAAQEDQFAFGWLASFYADPKFIYHDDVKALGWLLLATWGRGATLFPSDDVRTRERLLRSLSKDQIAAARSFADEWIRIHPSSRWK